MHIVTDTGADIHLPREQMPEIEVHFIHHAITLDGRTYHSGLDIQPAELQALLTATSGFPVTSQPSAGEFSATYRRLAATDPEILSVHMSSGLSGTVNAARAGAAMTPEAKVTIVDTKTLSAALGWQVAAAARAIKAGWPLAEILALIERIGAASDSLYTLDDLKYLIHGGRIGHMKGLLASALKLRPMIGVEKAGGTYAQLGVARTFGQALKGLVKLMTEAHKPGSALRVQVLHAHNPEAASLLHELIDPLFDCTWLPVNLLSPVLAAHTGPTMVGVAYAPLAAFQGIP